MIKIIHQATMFINADELCKTLTKDQRAEILTSLLADLSDDDFEAFSDLKPKQLYLLGAFCLEAIDEKDIGFAGLFKETNEGVLDELVCQAKKLKKQLEA